MRPLHRPMFRYGGPIKEGVMSGIREPHANGGRAALVGNPVYPRTSGREHHSAVKSAITSAAGKMGVGQTAKSTPGFIRTQIFPRVKNWWQRIKPTYRTQPGVVTGGDASTKAKYISQTMPPVSRMSKIRAFAKENPWWTYGGAYVGSPAVVGGLTSIPYKKAGMQMLDLAVPDWIWDQDKYFADKKAKEELEKDLETTETNPWKEKYEALLAANETPPKSDEQIRNERIQKYRDIMDIKGMNKRAAYDSLIDASKLISESGDFKGDIKSGKLISDIIQATSKAYDKPAKTKDAIDTLILKGEIEKDIKSSMPTEAEKTAAAFGISKDEYKKKLLGKTSAAEIIANISTKTGRVDSTTVASGYKAAGIVPKATITDTIVDEWLEDKDGKTEIDYVKEVISKADGFGPGLYVVGDRAILFDGTNYSYDY